MTYNTLNKVFVKSNKKYNKYQLIISNKGSKSNDVGKIGKLLKYLVLTSRIQDWNEV